MAINRVLNSNSIFHYQSMVSGCHFFCNLTYLVHIQRIQVNIYKSRPSLFPGSKARNKTAKVYARDDVHDIKYAATWNLVNFPDDRKQSSHARHCEEVQGVGDRIVCQCRILGNVGRKCHIRQDIVVIFITKGYQNSRQWQKHTYGMWNGKRSTHICIYVCVCMYIWKVIYIRSCISVELRLSYGSATDQYYLSSLPYIVGSFHVV